MWNLTAEDVQRAIEELNGRRAAIQAQFDAEMSRLDAELAGIKTVERYATDFISKHKEGASTVDPASAMREAAPPANGWGERALAENNADADAASADEKNPSRWRLRLGAEQVSP